MSGPRRLGDPKRICAPTRVGELLGADALEVPQLSDEQWAERDAVVQVERARKLAEETAAAAARQCADLIDRGVPARHLQRVLSGELRETDALQYVRERTGGLVVLIGPKGVGKSLAAVAWLLLPRAAPRYIAPGPARFVDAPMLARWPRYDEGRMRELERASALVLDDLGTEYDDKSGAFRSMLDGLINARYAADLPTLITTNIPSPAAFRERYGERIHDRVMETGAFIGCPGESLRVGG